MKVLILATFIGLVSLNAFGQSNYEMACKDVRNKKPTATALLTVTAAANPSRRIVSDIQETRSASDSESLPSFLIAQYKGDAGQVYITVDDGTLAGNLIATLDVKAIGKKRGEIARYRGTYKRFDTGRQLNVRVECVVTQ